MLVPCVNWYTERERERVSFRVFCKCTNKLLVILECQLTEFSFDTPLHTYHLITYLKKKIFKV